MAIRHAREQQSRVLAICNTNGSTIPRESDAVIYTHAGPEIGVASTKGFLTQLVACYLLGSIWHKCERPSTARKSAKPCGNSPRCLMPFPRCLTRSSR